MNAGWVLYRICTMSLEGVPGGRRAGGLSGPCDAGDGAVVDLYCVVQIVVAVLV